MSLSLVQSVVSLPTSPFVPIAVGFMGLGTGYLIYGPQELFGYPKRSEKVDFATGMWGIWLPGFMQFFTGVYLFFGLTVGTFTAAPLYMAALAFTAYGIHWFAIGWNRLHGGDARVNVGMAVGFLIISLLGIIVFFKAADPAVGGVFIGLALIYFVDFFASLKADLPKLGNPAEKALGFFRIGTGLWLLYLMWAVTLDTALGWTWLK
jgi:hypothetical protein